MFKGIDFYSDTVTRPTRAMRLAMVEAEVGDEQKGEDPTTLELERRAAELLGTTAAMFFPSATMANEVAIRLHTQPGDELVADENCHLFFAETGGPAVHAGVMTRGIPSPDGTFTGEDVTRFYRQAKGSHYPITRLVSVENTTNLGGGVAWPLDKLDSVVAASKKLGLQLHLDGSRLFNAASKTAVPVKRLTRGFDTITICLSKGLGCPSGALLGYDKSLFAPVRRLKQLMGGALRQSGILAAAGIYALDNHVDRLARDHESATQLAKGLTGLPGLRVESLEPSTNMVYFQWNGQNRSTDDFLAECEAKGVRFSQVGENRIRAVTHLDVGREDVAKALSIIQGICNA